MLVPQFYAKFIGYEIHTNKKKDTVWVCIPKERIKKLKQDIRRVVKTGLVVARSLARITGQIISMCKVLLPAKLLLRNIYRLLSSKASWQHKLTVDRASLDDLEWWLEALDNWNGKFFRTEPKHKIQLTTDASGRSWGGTIVGTSHKAQGFWDKEANTLSSNAKELLAVLLTLKSLLHSDSVTVCAMINFQGGAVRTLDILARNIWELAIRNNITIQAKHLAGKLNREADRLSRLPAQYKWHMHPKLFSYIDRIFGPHSIDRFASILTRQLPRYNSLYWDPETEGVDALHQSNWFTEVNFVNPPFRMLPQVINHICQTRAEATIIAPHWPAQTWARQLHRISVLPPLKLPKPRQMCIPCLDSIPEPMKNNRWALYAWRVSGKNI